MERPGTPLAEKRRLIREAAANCPALLNMWSELRERLPGYGFGRHELIPVRSTLEALAFYVGKYVSKSVPHRTKEMRGCRFVRYSQGWRVWKVSFGWATPRGWLWRRKTALLADALTIRLRPVRGEHYKADFRQIFGRRWAYQLQDIIQAVEVGEYPSKLHAKVSGVSEGDLEKIPLYAEDIVGLQSVGTLSPSACVEIALYAKFKLRYGGKFRDIARDALRAAIDGS